MSKLKFLLQTCAIIFAFNIQFIKSWDGIYENARLEKLREIVQSLRNQSSGDDSQSCVNFYNQRCINREVVFHDQNLVTVNDSYFRNLNESDPKISESEKKLKKYLLACDDKDINYVEQLKDLQIGKDIGGWPFFTPNWTEEKFNVAEIFGKMNRYGIRTNFIIYSLATNDWQLVFNPDLIYNESEIIDHFKEYNITTELFNIQDVAKEIVNFNEKILEIRKDGLRHISRDEHYTLKELKEKCPEFDWDTLCETYFNMPVENLPSTFQIGFDLSETMKKVINLIQNYDKKNLANYILWKMMVSEFYPWQYPYTLGHMLFIINPIVSKESIQKGYNKFNEHMYVSALEEVINLLENLNNHSLIKPESFESGMKEITENIEFISNYSDSVINNDLIDSHYSNLEMTSNFLQNLYNFNAKSRDLKLDFKKTQEISNVFSYFRKVSDIMEYYSPSFMVFNNFISSFWNKFVTADLDGTTGLQNATECIQKHLPGTGSDEAKMKIVYNEALRLTVKTYENWLEKYLEIKQKENEVLTEFSMNHRDLLLLYKTRADCNKNGGNGQKDITNAVNNCFKDGSMTCNVYDI